MKTGAVVACGGLAGLVND